MLPAMRTASGGLTGCARARPANAAMRAGSIADGHHRVDRPGDRRPDDRPTRPALVMKADGDGAVAPWVFDLVTATGGEDELRVSDCSRPPLASSTY